MVHDPFSPALRESGRKLQRQIWRLRLWQRERRLAKAEKELGLLGWQQADFDPETQRQVAEIQDVEREQTRLINEAADRAAKVRQRRAEYEAAQRGCQEDGRLLAAEEKRLREPLRELERKLAEKRKIEPNFGRLIPELDRELREVTKLLSELLGREQLNLKLRQEIIRLRERSVAIPNEKNDLRTQHFRTVAEIRALEETLAQAGQQLAKLEENRRQQSSAWSQQERSLQTAVEEEERVKAATEKKIQALEAAKANPYQAIGRVLAANGLAPMNQPEALERVKHLQFQTGEMQQRLLESHAASGKEDPRALRISYGFWAVILVLVGSVLVVAWR